MNKRSIISGNQIYGAQGFGIALARINGINVLNNYVHLANVGKAYRRGIHLENRTNGVTVSGNTVELAGGTGYPSGIGMVTFTDYDTPDHFSNGARRIDIVWNTVKGWGRGIIGKGFAKVKLKNNNLTQFNGTLYDFSDYVPGGSYSFDLVEGNLPTNP